MREMRSGEELWWMAKGSRRVTCLAIAGRMTASVSPRKKIPYPSTVGGSQTTSVRGPEATPRPKSHQAKREHLSLANHSQRAYVFDKKMRGPAFLPHWTPGAKLLISPSAPTAWGRHTCDTCPLKMCWSITEH